MHIKYSMKTNTVKTVLCKDGQIDMNVHMTERQSVCLVGVCENLLTGGCLYLSNQIVAETVLHYKWVEREKVKVT